MPTKLPPTPACRDPFDLPFLQFVIAGKVDYFVSDDKDALSLAGQFVCPIISADEFMKVLNK